jgi:hypothetical protein
LPDSLSYYWQPKTQAQRAALESDVEFLLFGGAAGSLKSETMLINAIKYRENKHMSSVIFRRTFPELEQLIRRSRDIYTPLGARFNEQKKVWSFPAGGTVRFAFCERDDDISRQYGNEYDFIGFDESTHFGEYPIRFMFSRLRSKDPFLQKHLRMHLASNPGNQGHVWHKAVFLGPTCTHCRIMPALSRLPGRVYTDAVWPSDGKKIGKTTAFIPGRLTDHTLLGADYIKQLDGLPAYLAKALRDGCWDVFAGQYFDCWDEKKCVKDKNFIYEQVRWYYPHWIGADYGFNVSTAVAYLAARGPATPEFPNGRIFIVDEYAAAHRMAIDYAQDVKDRWHVGERKIHSHYLSPDAWAKRGDGHSLAQQMIDQTLLSWEPASNDRVGGAMMLYTLLQSGELVISENCLLLKAAIPSRVHDPKEPDKVLKVPGDPYDDAYDAARYTIYSYIQAAVKPRDVLLAEAMEGFSKDPTVAMIQRRMLEAKMQQSDEPVFYSHFRRPI